MTCAACRSTAPLCAACRDQRRAWAIGIVRNRGEAWAARVRAVAPERAWPAWEASERVRSRARALVADLAIGDDQLALEFARACAEAAARDYAAPPVRPGALAFDLTRRS